MPHGSNVGTSPGERQGLYLVQSASEPGVAVLLSVLCSGSLSVALAHSPQRQAGPASQPFWGRMLGSFPPGMVHRPLFSKCSYCSDSVTRDWPVVVREDASTERDA